MKPLIWCLSRNNTDDIEICESLTYVSEMQVYRDDDDDHDGGGSL